MANAFLAELSSRGVVALGGPEARAFLQNLVTGDLDEATGGIGSAALLTPQGKILFDFLYVLDGETILIDVMRTALPDVLKRLGFYRLRAKITIEDRAANFAVVAGWGGPQPTLKGIAADPRLAALGWRGIVPRPFDPASAPGHAIASEADYHAHRIHLAVPEGGADYGSGEVFPHEADLDQLAGVCFRKGCFVGQEVVSRMEHRGTARRRFIGATGTAPMAERGTPVLAGEVPIGTMGSSSGGQALALVRLDRAHAAMSAGTAITAGGWPVRLDLPRWARFSWPVNVHAD